MANPSGYTDGYTIGKTPSLTMSEVEQYVQEYNNGIKIIDSVVVKTTVPDTIALTPIYMFIVPGGTLGTDKQLRLLLTGRFHSNVLGPPIALAWQVEYGAFIIPLSPVATIPIPGISSWDFRLNVKLTARNSANSQEVYSELFSTLDAAGLAFNVANCSCDTLVEPSANPLPLRVQVQWNVLPGTNPSVEVNSAVLELLD